MNGTVHGIAAAASSGRMRGWWGLALLVAGGLQAASLAWPGNGQPLWWLQILSLSVLCAGVYQAPSAKNAALRAWWFATVWLGGAFWWLFVSMHTYGGLPAPLAVLAVLALAAALGGYYAAAAYAWKRWLPRGWWSVLGFAACWTLAELARGTWWTGFPWGAGGYAHVEGPLSVWPRWVGVYGVGALAAWLAMALAQLRQLARGKAVALSASAGALLWVAAWWQGQALQAFDLPPRPAVSVALLQGNIAQDEKFIPGEGVAQSLQWYGDQLRHPTASLTVAPETAIPLLPHQLPEGYVPYITAPYQVDGGQNAALVGIPMLYGERAYSNAVWGWQPGKDEAYRYNKHHLVPFGEFIPPLFRWFVAMMNIPLGDFHQGSLGQPPFVWGGERWGLNICYEDLFGEELAARFEDAAQAPTVLVNVSNIAWFGNTSAIPQHLHISRMRTLELARPMLRATNTGATAVIDSTGRVTAQLPPHTQGVLQAQVHGREGITPFAWWASRWGLWPLWWAAGLVVAGLMWLQKKTSKTTA